VPATKETVKIVSPENNATTPQTPRSVSQPIEAILPITSGPTSTRAKSTFNLHSILKAKEQPPTVITPIEEPVDVKPLTEDQLREAWAEYARLRKDQVAEFHLLSREIDLNGSIVTVALANTVEEPLLQSMMTDLVTYLRNRLSNPTIKIESVMKASDKKKIAYTNKEKFDLLVEKNPVLKELKDRLGLDPDF
jgi:DNA polymerase-3 subunit gamma/tau